MPAAITTESFHEIAFPPEAVWPILSKTDWVNRSTGLPPVQYDIRALPEGGSVVNARARMLGMDLCWRENPFEWVEGQFYRVHRQFDRGPLVEVEICFEFASGDHDSTRLRVFTKVTPRHFVGAWLARNVLARKSSRDMARIVAHLEKHLRERKLPVLPNLPAQPVHQPPFQAALQKLRAAGLTEYLISRLSQLLAEAPDAAVCRLRPFEVAREWGCDRWQVLRLFLWATRCGLLNLSWEVLCPNCRSTRAPLTTSLSQISREAHCEACQIKFDAEFDKSVELKFAINPAIRPCDAQTFCLAGPGAKPHVVSQLYLQPGEEREWGLPKLSGGFRLRSPQVREAALLGADAGSKGTKGALIECRADVFAGAESIQNLSGAGLRIKNPNSHPVLVALERSEWSPDVLTAAQATNWQEFRDLFAGEAVSPREQITVGSQIVLFTDLRSSTAMYCRIGDAPAYALVRDHFQVLYVAIGRHHGAVVKTIGDAVMAVFSRVDEALAAVSEMHRDIAVTGQGSGVAAPLVLKSALHVGPCLAVNANDKLDFFGTTINFAARLVDRSQGGDVVVSDELHRRPEMMEFLAGLGRKAEPLDVQFRGFEQAQKVWRIEVLKKI